LELKYNSNTICTWAELDVVLVQLVDLLTEILYFSSQAALMMELKPEL
jgi:hypothetical protein